MKISIIILNWNGAKYISKCLESVKKLQTGPFTLEKVIVDNASTDDSPQLIAKNFSDFTLLKNPTNMGYAGGNNTGIRYALNSGADFVWILNSDVLVKEDALIKYIEGAAKYPTAGIFGCKIYFAPGFEFQKDRYAPNEIGKVVWYAGGQMDWKNVVASHRGVDQVDKGQFDQDGETDFVTGASMFIRRKVFDSIGNFDAKYFLYFEENDFCQRAVRSGYKLMYLCQPVVWHENAQATGMGSPLQDYFITRNKLLFGMRYAAMYTKQALLREGWHLYKSGRPWQKQGAADFFNGKFGVGSYT